MQEYVNAVPVRMISTESQDAVLHHCHTVANQFDYRQQLDEFIKTYGFDDGVPKFYHLCLDNLIATHGLDQGVDHYNLICPPDYILRLDAKTLLYETRWDFIRIYGHQLGSEAWAQACTVHRIRTHYMHHMSTAEQKERIDWDVGEKSEIGDGEVDRCTTLPFIMASFGRSFDTPFLTNLMTHVGKYPDGSRFWPKGESIYGFISYRWSTGRRNLYLAFCSFFGMPILMITTCIHFKTHYKVTKI